MIAVTIGASLSMFSFTSFILISIFIEKNIFCDGNSKQCTTSKNRLGLMETKCDLHHENIPKDISAATQILDLSDTDPDFHPNDFDRFASTLLELNLSGIPTMGTQASVDARLLKMLLPLNKLEVLDISRSDLSNNAFYLLPASIRKFLINDNLYQTIEISNCPNLNEVRIANNHMVTIPTLLFPPAPIEELYMRHNPLTSLVVEDFAPFCNLLKVDIRFSDLVFTENYCRCMTIKQWLTDYKVSGYEDVECNPPKDEVKCNINLSEAKRIRESLACVNPDQYTRSNIAKWILGILFFIVAFSGSLFIIYEFFGLEILFGEPIAVLNSTTNTPQVEQVEGETVPEDDEEEGDEE